MDGVATEEALTRRFALKGLLPTYYIGVRLFRRSPPPFAISGRLSYEGDNYFKAQSGKIMEIHNEALHLNELSAIRICILYRASCNKPLRVAVRIHSGFEGRCFPIDLDVDDYVDRPNIMNGDVVRVNQGYKELRLLGEDHCYTVVSSEGITEPLRASRYPHQAALVERFHRLQRMGRRNSIRLGRLQGKYTNCEVGIERGSGRRFQVVDVPPVTAAGRHTNLVARALGHGPRQADGTHTVIQIFSSRGGPFASLFEATATLLVNAITPDGIYCFYRDLTTSGQGLAQLQSYIINGLQVDTKNDDWGQCFDARRWTTKHTHSLMESSSWVCLLSGIPHTNRSTGLAGEGAAYMEPSTCHARMFDALEGHGQHGDYYV
ncbi:hypothetical protein BKA70DRAFT_1228076 [Coprinopsis sp. MPI-PUGE-AT-0042]|nr:hypothetical protein BKA70DRAFT_1228076 [Coprinopsis sp. MPI-PUGE-AT-0042]